MKFLQTISFVALAVTALANPLQKRSTPAFYLIAESTDPSVNLKPVLVGSGSGAPLSVVSGTPTTFHLNDFNGLSSGSGTDFVSVDYHQVDAGSCGTSGQVIRLTGGSSNKCSNSQGFFLSSYDQNAQLGAKLVNNFVGGFVTCSGNIWYTQTGTLAGCTPVTLWTVPASL